MFQLFEVCKVKMAADMGPLDEVSHKKVMMETSNTWYELCLVPAMLNNGCLLSSYFQPSLLSNSISIFCFPAQFKKF